MEITKTNWPLTVLLVILAPIWVPFLIFLLLILAIVIPITYVLVQVFVWCFWLTRGKDVLFIYSDSPIWRDYMLSEVLPLVESRAVVLNWSERRSWNRWSLRVLAFRLFGGQRAFNPLIVVFRPFRWARKFRFWPAFREWKQGNKHAVEKLKHEVTNTLSLSP